MGCYYKIAGKIPLKPDVPPSAVEELQGRLGNAEIDIEDGPRLHVFFADATSYGWACEIDDLLVDFAEKYASMGAVLEVGCDGEAGVLAVGPDKRSRLRAEIEHIDKQVDELEARRLDMLKQMNELP